MGASRVIVAVALCLAAAGCGPRHQTSESFDHLKESAPDSISFYTLNFYPSTIRMISHLPGQDFGSGFDGIERARAFLAAGEAGVGLSAQFVTLRQNLLQEDFESLMYLKSHETSVDVYLREGDPPHYVVVYSDPAATFALEMIGTVSAAALHQLGSIDPAGVMDFFDIQTPEKDSTDTSHARRDSIRVEVSF